VQQVRIQLDESKETGRDESEEVKCRTQNASMLFLDNDGMNASLQTKVIE
jgi:hypothetical protein